MTQEKGMKERLAESKNYAVIVTNNNADQLIYAGPIFRYIYHQYGLKANVFTTFPLNHNWLSVLKGLPYVEDVHISPTIEKHHFDEMEKKFDTVMMLNFGAAVAQGLPRGMNPTMSMAAMVQLAMTGESVLTFDLPDELVEEATDSAKKYLTEKNIDDFVVFSPFFAKNVPLEQINAQAWPRENWIDLINKWKGTVVILGESHNDVIVPDGIETNIFSVNTDDFFLHVGLIHSAQCLISIDNWYAVVARALKKKIVQIHTGMPISWSGATYSHLSEYHGLSTIVASIVPTSIKSDHVIDAYQALIGRLG